MKKVIAILAMMVLSLVSVMGAMDVTVTPDEVTLPKDGSNVYVQVTVSGSSTYPRPLKVDGYCKEVSGDPDICDASDVIGTSEINVAVDPQTDGSGIATATLSWNGPGMGKYHYTICVDDGTGNCFGSGAEVTGDALIPEFTVIASLAVLGLAGVYIAKKRK
jgi:hypothetical protein